MAEPTLLDLVARAAAIYNGAGVWSFIHVADAAEATVAAIERGSPGVYNVVWDGRDEKKALVPLGDYYVCIEAAREHGPYELIRESVAIGKTVRPALKSSATSHLLSHRL